MATATIDKIDSQLADLQSEIDYLKSQIEIFQAKLSDLEHLKAQKERVQDKTSKVLTEAESLNVEIPSKEEFEKVHDIPYKKFGLQGTPCQKTIALKAMSVMYLG